MLTTSTIDVTLGSVRPFFLFSSLLAFAAGCSAKANPKVDGADPPPVAVTVVDVTQRPMPRWLVLTGELLAGQESSVAANANGKVMATLVERGQRVEAGAVLVSLDAKSASLSAQAAAAQSNMM